MDHISSLFLLLINKYMELWEYANCLVNYESRNLE